MSLIRISESDNWIVDYDKERGQYRVSYFEDGHFVDDFWFKPYEEEHESIQAALNNRPDITLFNASYNADNCTFEQIKNAIDEFNRMCAESAKSDKEMYEEQAIKMLTNWDKD